MPRTTCLVINLSLLVGFKPTTEVFFCTSLPLASNSGGDLQNSKLQALLTTHSLVNAIDYFMNLTKNCFTAGGFEAIHLFKVHQFLEKYSA